MLNIHSHIEERKKYPIEKAKFDTLVEKINQQELRENVFFVVPEGFLFTLCNKQRDVFELKYKIAGVFDMGAPYLNTAVNMTLVHAVPHPVSEMKVGIFTGDVFNRKRFKMDIGEGIATPQEYYNEFNEYVYKIEKWITDGIVPDNDEDGRYEYNSITIEEVDPKKRYPKYYSKQALEIRKLLVNEKAVLLSEVADIVRPFEDRHSSEVVKRVKGIDLKYPMNIKAIQKAKPTNIILQKGDIIFPVVGNATPYLYNEESNERIYANPNTIVIKCRDILPEYLYLYLISETAKSVLEAVTSYGSIKCILVQQLANLPVILPVFDKQKYISDFELLSGLASRQYNIETGEFNAYYAKLKEIQEHTLKAESIEDILNVEVLSKIKVHNEQQLRDFLTDDLKELNTCYKGKAYKATLILAGSILEAVLIDWLSEIHHTNYFEHDYIVTDQRTGKEKRADLVDYINEIKYIERPRWMSEATKAHEIRKKRNLVHAKLCLKSEDINDEVCLQVIQYLKDVLKTRGIK